MRIVINLPPDLEQGLVRQAEQTDTSLQALILQALRQIIQPLTVSTTQWPEAVLAGQGNPDFPAFESQRDDLLSPREAELF